MCYTVSYRKTFARSTRTKEGLFMAAGSKPKYYLVEASVLPEIFAKVIEAK